MLKHTLLTLGIALLASGCASRYTTLPADPGVTPDADALLKKMSTSLASSSHYRFTANRTIPPDRAEKMNQPAKATVEVVVARPDKLAVKVTSKGAPNEMVFDGRTFTVVDGPNQFYSKAPLKGTLDNVPGQLARVYGFQPPLAEFIVSDPYRDIKGRVESVSYLGKGTVNEGGKTVQCQRIGLNGAVAGAELWLAESDSLPRRLLITAKDPEAGGTIMDVDFLGWDLNAQVSDSTFRHQPPAGAEETPMISLSEAAAAQR